MAAFAKTRAGAGPSPSVPTGPQFDNRRLLAGVIDLMVPLGFALAARAAGLSLTLGVLVVALGWGLYYCFALESSGGQTLGKRVMKLRVVSADGSPATDAQIAKRTLVRILEWNVIGLIVMLVSGERRQRLGDMVAGTVVTDAVATEPEAIAERPATNDLPAAGPSPDVTEPKRRRGLKDLAKLEIGGSKKKKKAAVGPAVVAPAAVAGPSPDVKEPKRRRGLKDLAKLEIGGSKKKKVAVEPGVAAAAAETQPKKRRNLKDLGKIEIGRKKQVAEEPAAVMAAPAHPAESLPAEALPESLRPDPEPVPTVVDPIDEHAATPPQHEPEVTVSPDYGLDHEPVVEADPAPMPIAGPEPTVEIEREPVVELDAEPDVYEPMVELDTEPEFYEPVDESEPLVTIEPASQVPPEQSLYAHIEADPVAEPEPMVEIEREPEVLVETGAMSNYLPEPTLYAHADPESGQPEPLVEIEEPGGFAEAEPEPSPYAHLKAEPSPFGEDGSYGPAEPSTSLYQHAPEPESTPSPAQHPSRYPETEATDTPAPIVKPIETVSAMDLLMQEVEERQAGSDGSSA